CGTGGIPPLGWGYGGFTPRGINLIVTLLTAITFRVITFRCIIFIVIRSILTRFTLAKVIAGRILAERSSRMTVRFIPLSHKHFLMSLYLRFITARFVLLSCHLSGYLIS